MMPEKNEISYIQKCLDDAKEHGLEAEVVAYALSAMKEDPKKGIIETMEIGMMEWYV